MKRFFILATALSLSACASPKPVNKWAPCGLTEQQGFYLESHGLMNPIEAQDWIVAGVSSPEQIIAWRATGLSSLMASKFIQAGITTPEAARSWLYALNANQSPATLSVATIKTYKTAADTGTVTPANIGSVIHSLNIDRNNTRKVLAIAKSVNQQGLSPAKAAEQLKL
ncbi:hypothetical protein [Acetobacter thailandicus]|uniref:hypothetical protein n=1 Tax=Acetobacter thailandicus TaxID=1502842 RepID=UPI001BA49906|nr:hypothetical protein [Acetobacter thailandicus]MBS0980680.1 hypothetical protein [Acetobacter thailandicus]MBS1003657.1 hypothetical protein [Acetobacter thailandicus]